MSDKVLTCMAPQAPSLGNISLSISLNGGKDFSTESLPFMYLPRFEVVAAHPLSGPSSGGTMIQISPSLEPFKSWEGTWACAFLFNGGDGSFLEEETYRVISVSDTSFVNDDGVDSSPYITCVTPPKVPFAHNKDHNNESVWVSLHQIPHGVASQGGAVISSHTLAVKQNGGGTALPKQGFWFTYLPNAVVPGPLFPSSGPSQGGTKVRFTWSAGRISPPIVCSFGGSVVPAIWLDSYEQVECISPPQISTLPHSARGGNVAVEFQISTDGSYWILHKMEFLYYSENITSVTSISPSFGFEYGTTELIVTGSGFLPSTGLLGCVFAFDASLLHEATASDDHEQPTLMVPAKWLSSQTLSCIAPPSVPGKAFLSVTMNGGVNVLPGTVPYQYHPQVFVSTSSFPSFGPIGGGTTVYLEGQGLWVVENNRSPILPPKCMCRFGSVETQGDPVIATNIFGENVSGGIIDGDDESLHIVGLECIAPAPLSQMLQRISSISAVVAAHHHRTTITVPLSISFNSGGDWLSVGLWTYLDPLGIASICPKHGSSMGVTTVNVKLDRLFHSEEENSNLLAYCEFIDSAAIHNGDATKSTTLRVPASRMQNWEEGAEFNCTIGPSTMVDGSKDIKLVFLKSHDNGDLVVVAHTVNEMQHQFIVIPPLEVFGYSITTAPSPNGVHYSNAAGNKRRQWIRVSGSGFIDAPEFACRWPAAPLASRSSSTVFYPSVAAYISGEVALCSAVEEELLEMSKGGSLSLGVTVNGQDFYGENISIDLIHLLNVYPSRGLALGGNHTVEVVAEGIGGSSLILQQLKEFSTDLLQTMLTPHLDCKWTLPDGSKSASKAHNIIVVGSSTFLTWHCLVPTSLQSGNGSLAVEPLSSPWNHEVGGGGPLSFSSRLLLSTKALDFSFVDPPRVLTVVPSHVLSSGGVIMHLSGLHFDYWNGSAAGEDLAIQLHCIFQLRTDVIITSKATVESPSTAICLSPETRLYVNNDSVSSTSATLSPGLKEWPATEARSIPIFIHPPPTVYSIKQQRNLVTVHGSGFIPSLSMSCTFGDVMVKPVSISAVGLQCLAPKDSHPGPGMFQERSGLCKVQTDERIARSSFPVALRMQNSP